MKATTCCEKCGKEITGEEVNICPTSYKVCCEDCVEVRKYDES